MKESYRDWVGGDWMGRGIMAWGEFLWVGGWLATGKNGRKMLVFPQATRE